jgi:hypothetical protein
LKPDFAEGLTKDEGRKQQPGSVFKTGRKKCKTQNVIPFLKSRTLSACDGAVRNSFKNAYDLKNKKYAPLRGYGNSFEKAMEECTKVEEEFSAIDDGFEVEMIDPGEIREEIVLEFSDPTLIEVYKANVIGQEVTKKTGLSGSLTERHQDGYVGQAQEGRYGESRWSCRGPRLMEHESLETAPNPGGPY